MKNANPFIAGPMLRYPEKFVGRKHELRAIVNRMVGSQPTSVNIVGEHQIGKSSLLYYFFLTWEQRVSQPENYVVIYLSLQNAGCQTEKDFYQELAQELLSCSSVKKQPKLVALLQKPLDRLSFSRAIEEFKKLGLLPVLCLDDFESLFENRDEHRKEFDNGFYDNLRSLMNNSALMLVIASCKKLDFYAEKHRFVSSFFNVGHVIALGELTTDEAIKLTRLPVDSQQALSALTLEEQRSAKRWGRCHPYLLQLAGSCLWQARQDQRNFQSAKKQFDYQKKSKNKYICPKWQQFFILLIAVIVLLIFLDFSGFSIWEFFKYIGEFSQIVGSLWDDAIKMIIGLIIVILPILFIFKIFSWEEFREILSKFLGK